MRPGSAWAGEMTAKSWVISKRFPGMHLTAAKQLWIQSPLAVAHAPRPWSRGNGSGQTDLRIRILTAAELLQVDREVRFLSTSAVSLGLPQGNESEMQSPGTTLPALRRLTGRASRDGLKRSSFFLCLMTAKHLIADNLASAFLSGAWSLEPMTRRGAEACGHRHRWLRPLIRRLLARFGNNSPRPDAESLSHCIEEDHGFSRAWASACKQGKSLLGRVFWTESRMCPRPGPPERWSVPSLTTPRALAEWLQLSPTELEWLADPQERLRRHSLDRQHYGYQSVPKRFGQFRLLEIPRPRLKAVQRQILRGILDRIPPHESAHGFRKGHSILSYVQPHAQRAIVLHLDLCNYFVSIPGSRAHALFRTAGYPKSVARLLTGLCAHSAPADIPFLREEPFQPRDWNERQRFLSPHLPQGAPTSPALANLCTYRFDCRVAGLARSIGGRYTRYADDLLLSGDEILAQKWRSIYHRICVIALEEGFEIHTRKTRLLRRGCRQQVSGVVLNEHPNVKREDFDQLKAILYNCARYGPEGQNRESHPDFRAHLAGRIAYVALLNPARGEKLKQIFARIEWQQADQ